MASAAHNRSHEYGYGTAVAISASPDSISDFTGWSGCDEVVFGQCRATVDAAKTVTATFTQRRYALTIEAVGPGSGSVSCDGAPCASSYPEGTAVTLHADPGAGSTFYGNRALRHRVRALLLRARHARNPHQAVRLRRRAHRLALAARPRAKVAQRLAQQTKRCRRS